MSRVSLDIRLRQLALLPDISNFAHLTIKPMLRVLLRQTDQHSVPEPVRARPIAGIQLRAEIAAHGNKGVHRDQVPPLPTAQGTPQRACRPPPRATRRL